MFNILSKKLTTTFIDFNIISPEDRDIYIYSFELLLSAIANLLVVVAMILLTGRVFSGMIFVATFLTLRQSVGGYHATTHLWCVLSFIVIFTVFLSIISMLPHVYYFSVIIGSLVLAVPIILFCAPVAHVNKPLSKNERFHLRRVAQVLTILLTIFLLATSYMDHGNIASLSIALSMLTVSVSALAGKVKNQK